MNLEQRWTKSENLDNLEVGGDYLTTTLRELAQINQLLGNNRVVNKAILKTIKSLQLKTVRIVDLGCGGGDLLRSIQKTLNKIGVKSELMGIDGNPNTIEYARQNSQNIQFEVADILSTNFNLPSCDILVSSHFMYHFQDTDFVHFFNKQLHKVKLVAIVSELKRHALAYWGFKIFAPFIVSKSTVSDGLIAIRRAFKLSELEHVVQQINYSTEVKASIGFRLLLCIKH